MHKLTLLAARTLTVLSIFSLDAFAAVEPVPCENMLKDLKKAVKSAKLDDADKAKVADLQSQGTERCKADDDAGADALFTEAMKLIGK